MLPIRSLIPYESNEQFAHPAWADDETLIAECNLSRLRRGGPGGQNRNKVETAVRLEHQPSGVIAEGNEHRTQRENKKVALRRLRMRLALEVRTPPLDYPHWHDINAHRRIGAKPDARTGPQLVAHVLNVLDAVNQNDAVAARLLEVSRSQLTRFLKADGHVQTRVNELRKIAGRGPMR